MTKARLSTLALLLVAFSPTASRADVGLLRTAQALDEARGYCLDIAGFGATLRLDDPLQAHTCKYGSDLDDQSFEPIAGGAIKTRLGNRCLAVAALEPGARLVVRTCTSAPTQQWTLTWGRLSPDSRRDLCVSVANAKGEIAGTPALVSPVYRRRDVALERCDESQQARQAFRWSQPDERGLSSADVVRNGMPADVAKQLAAFGTEFDGDIAGQTAKIYATQPRVYDAAELKVVKNVAYGSHERQQLDIHTATMRRSERPVPVVVVFHGGGLIGGSRAATANVADYFASLGYVGVNGGYRLAPDSKWPEGARDVGAAVTWLKSHAAEYGGDPEQIFVVGLSTGAYHAATYVFRPELLLPGTARPAGAILLSGPYSFDFASPSKGELVYFGEDPKRWPEMVIPGHVTRADIPVLFTTAEWDNARYLWPQAAVYKELVEKHSARPHYKQSPGHNHSSQLLSVGTPDTSVSRELVDFIERTVRH
jgi:triacylglycerol lipase